MNYKVLKFGGSSLETLEKMKHVASKIIKEAQSGFNLVVVVSAMGKSTNQLIALAKEASSNPNKRELDALLSTGEQVSISLLSMMLQDDGYPAIGLSGFQAKIKTSGLHTNNRIDDIDVSLIQKHSEEGKIVVVAGFQGINDQGDITTLGRGGSDTTAIALAAKLGCHCDIYTDVTGIYGVDPRLVPQAKQLETISVDEMKEMAFLGAKVMEPRSIDIAQHYGVIVRVAHAHIESQGTLILKEDMMEHRPITGCSVIEKIVLVNIQHVPASMSLIAHLFVTLANEGINIDMISQTQSSDGFVTLAFTASSDDLDNLEHVLRVLTQDQPQAIIHVDKHVSKVSVVGSGMRSQSGVAARLFQLFADHHIAYKLITTSEISISYTMSKDHTLQAVQLIAQEFGL
ncbi:MAG: aspartate kinase [Erysipelotrichaceae bacterium]|nr:aspartate kinase [Erysipelotrichaceae bacterium]